MKEKLEFHTSSEFSREKKSAQVSEASGIVAHLDNKSVGLLLQLGEGGVTGCNLGSVDLVELSFGNSNNMLIIISIFVINGRRLCPGCLQDELFVVIISKVVIGGLDRRYHGSQGGGKIVIVIIIGNGLVQVLQVHLLFQRVVRGLGEKLLGVVDSGAVYHRYEQGG